jgi:PEP-CTERM motif
MKSSTFALWALMAVAQTPAQASLVSLTPTLPPVGAPYLSSGAGCFPLAGVCVVPGTVTIDSVQTSGFNLNGQDFVTNISLLGTLTDLSNGVIGPVMLTGTMEEQVIGRTFSTETGTWDTELLDLSLTGPVLGNTLSVILDSAHASGGQTSVTPDGAVYLIDSFFDVFADLTLDGTPPLHAAIGPLRLTLADSTVTAVPEPSSIALIGLTLAALGWQRRGRPAI